MSRPMICWRTDATVFVYVKQVGSRHIGPPIGGGDSATASPEISQEKKHPHSRGGRNRRCFVADAGFEGN